MEPTDACGNGGEKRKAFKRSSSEAEFFGENEAFFSSWTPDMHGAKSPDPSEDVVADAENLMLGVDNNSGPSEYGEEEEQHVLYNDSCAGVNGVLLNGWPLAIAPAQARSHVKVNTTTTISVDNRIEQERKDTIAAPRRKKKPKSKCGPKRPLSAYNLFFRDYRRCLIQKTGSTEPFDTMGKTVGKKWKSLSNRERDMWEQRAEQESMRYREELVACKEKNKNKRRSGYTDCLDDVKQDEPEQTVPQTSGLAEEPAAPSMAELRKVFSFHQQAFNSIGAKSNIDNDKKPGTTKTIIPFDQGRHEQRHSFSALPVPPPSRPGLNNTSLRGFVDLGASAVSRARDVVNFPEGFTFPEELPPSGTEIYLADGTGALRPHKLSWKVYSVPLADAESIMRQFKYG